MTGTDGSPAPGVKDRFSALWVSYSSISDYLKCPRAYYLRNIWRDPKTNRKVTLMQPPLALGQCIHDTIEALSVLSVDKRKVCNILEVFENKWQGVAGLRGGFRDASEEEEFRQKGIQMIDTIRKNPGPLYAKAIKIRKDLPYFWLSDEDNIILCGKIDWIEYLDDTDSVHIIDFKTGRHEEDEESLQLPIYVMLATECQSRPVSRVSYWYLIRDKKPRSVPLPDINACRQTVLDIAKRIALARKLERFTCKNKDGCMFCRPFERIIRGEARKVGINAYKQDVYIVE